MVRRQSTALRVPAGKSFSDDLAEIGTKDCASKPQGKWIVDTSDLDAFRKADVTIINSPNATWTVTKSQNISLSQRSKTVRVLVWDPHVATSQ